MVVAGRSGRKAAFPPSALLSHTQGRLLGPRRASASSDEARVEGRSDQTRQVTLILQIKLKNIRDQGGGFLLNYQLFVLKPLKITFLDDSVLLRCYNLYFTPSLCV
jgi:hypothetical protein